MYMGLRTKSKGQQYRKGQKFRYHFIDFTHDAKF